MRLYELFPFLFHTDYLYIVQGYKDKPHTSGGAWNGDFEDKITSFPSVTQRDEGRAMIENGDNLWWSVFVSTLLALGAFACSMAFEI